MSYEMTDLSDTRSVRTDRDSWDITESVGSTALGVAACRAVETGRDDALIRDEFARLLVAAAGPEWARMADGNLDWQHDDDVSRREFESAVDYQAVRTHFFDQHFAASVRAGIGQVVILAAGLDSRAFRLEWPAGTVIFEIDQPKVLSFKTLTLQGHAVTPRAAYRPVAVDLRDDWAAALIDAGFDRHRPTTWLAEGLLPYLPSDAQDRLFDSVTELSAPGSRIAVEAFALDDGNLTEERRLARRERQARVRERMGTGSADVEALLYNEADRAEADRLLAGHGWHVDTVKGRDEMARLGRPVPADLTAEAVASDLISAHLPEEHR